MFQCLKDYSFGRKKKLTKIPHLLRNLVQAVRRNYGLYFNEKYILPRREMFGEKTAQGIRIVWPALLRNSKCVLFGRKKKDL